MIRRPPRSTLDRSSAASDVYKRQDLSWVAQGSFGLYIERFLRPWDCSGGAVILREAGGIISDWQGDETQWLYNGQIFAASSPRVHEKALSLLQ